jgi:hypothetical protein
MILVKTGQTSGLPAFFGGASALLSIRKSPASLGFDDALPLPNGHKLVSLYAV